MTDLNEKDLAQRIKTQLQNCHGFDGDEISTARSDALDYYFQRKRGDEVTGRSAVVSGDVSAMVEATLAQMVDAFDSDQIVQFDAFDATDEEQAALESAAVQYYCMEYNNGFLELISACKEALLLRNGVIKIDAEDVTRRRTHNYSNVSPDALADMLDMPGVVDNSYDEDTQELGVTTELTSREFRMQSVPLENFLYFSEWHSPMLEGIPVVAVRHLDTRSDVQSMGFPKSRVDSLTAHRHDLKSESYSRNPRHGVKPGTPVDTSQDLIEWYEVYIEMDAGNGIAELRRISISYTDAEILENIPVPFIRLAAGTAIINPHRFTGISLYDKLKQNQDMRTQLRRALLDNVNATTKNRTAGLDEVVNTDDLSDGRVNNHVRVKNIVQDVRQAITPLVVPDTSANILANLESTARERTEMGGAALDLQTAQMQIGGDRMGSQGLDRAYSVAEMLSASMLKTLATTLLRSVFLLAHRTLREYFDQPLPIKRNGRWTTVKPTDWPERHSLTVKPGMSPGERTRRINALGQVIDAQMMLADRGMDQVLVDLDGFNRALMDWARLAEVQNPEQYFIDPQSPRAQAALQNKEKQRAEQDMQSKALMQQAFGLEQLRIAFEKYRTDADRQFNYYNAVLGAEIEEAKIVGGVTGDLVKAQAEGNAQQANGSRTTGEEPATSGDTE